MVIKLRLNTLMLLIIVLTSACGGLPLAVPAEKEAMQQAETVVVEVQSVEAAVTLETIGGSASSPLTTPTPSIPATPTPLLVIPIPTASGPTPPPINTPTPAPSPTPTPTFEPLSDKPIGGYIFSPPKLILTHNYIEIIGWVPDSNEELIIRNFDNDKFLIETLNINTGLRQRLVETDHFIVGKPIWLPATKQIAYLAQDETGAINLYLNNPGEKDVDTPTVSQVSPPLVPDKTGDSVLVFDSQTSRLLDISQTEGATEKLLLTEPLSPVGFGPYPQYQATWNEKTDWIAYYHPEKLVLVNSQTNQTQTVDLGKAPGEWGQWGAIDAAWSADGQRLAIIATSSEVISATVPFTQLIIYDPATGKVQLIADDLTYITNMAWAPDNENVLISGVIRQNKEGLDVNALFLVDVTTQQIVPVPVMPDGAHGLSWHRSLTWSPDGKYIVVGYTEVPTEGRWYRISVKTEK
jgi:WD40 repeat protein